MAKSRFLAGLIVLAAALTAARSAGAQELSITTSFSAGVMLGGAKEFVYDHGYVLSELDWPLLPAITVGAAVSLATSGGFLASLEIQTAVPMMVGSMTDSDFLNYDGVKTHFSQSDGVLRGAFLFTAQAGWALPLPSDQPLTLIAPFLQFEYMFFQWDAENGYIQYPPEPPPGPYTPWSPSTPKVPINGTGIIYTQNYLIPAMGMKAVFRFLDTLTVNVSVAFSPYLWCFDTDQHLFRSLVFYDNPHGGIMIEPRLSATLNVNPRVSLGFDALYRHIEGLIGDTQVTGAVSQYETNSSGVSLDEVSLSLTLTYRLYGP
jgi:outer membrane protease